MELVQYFVKENISFNDKIQDYNNLYICGHIYLYVLIELNKNEHYKSIL